MNGCGVRRTICVRVSERERCVFNLNAFRWCFSFFCQFYFRKLVTGNHQVVDLCFHLLLLKPFFSGAHLSADWWKYDTIQNCHAHSNSSMFNIIFLSLIDTYFTYYFILNCLKINYKLHVNSKNKKNHKHRMAASTNAAAAAAAVCTRVSAVCDARK